VPPHTSRRPAQALRRSRETRIAISKSQRRGDGEYSNQAGPCPAGRHHPGSTEPGSGISIDGALLVLRHPFFQVDHFQHGTQGFDPYTINIGGTEEVWKKMMERRPKPFYHDWFAASFHHDFTFGGDLESAYAHYYAIRRINAIMRQTVIESRAV
jgi:hypothetical protein